MKVFGGPDNALIFEWWAGNPSLGMHPIAHGRIGLSGGWADAESRAVTLPFDVHGRGRRSVIYFS
jgi:hypothetical protein